MAGHSDGGRAEDGRAGVDLGSAAAADPSAAGDVEARGGQEDALDLTDVGGTDAPDRGPRPSVEPGRRIADYRTDELVAVIRWIESDTLLRTEEELVTEAMRELGFGRKGSRITATITDAVRQARAGTPADAEPS
jgi:hypothetical protein